MRIRVTFNADPDPSTRFNVNSDPAPHRSDANLRLLVYRSSRAPFLASTPPFVSFYGIPPRLHLELVKILNFDPNPDLAFTLGRIQILLHKIIRIYADPDPQPWRKISLLFN